MDSTHHTNQSVKKRKASEPIELTSKKPMSRFRKVIPTQKKMIKDPRFDESSGTFNVDLFQKSYDWVNDLKKEEFKSVQSTLKKEKNEKRKIALQKWLESEKSRQKTLDNLRQKKDILRDRKKLEADLVSQGKKPYYLKDSDKKQLVLIENYKNIVKKSSSHQPGQDSAALKNVLEKRRQRTASRQHTKLPVRNIKD